MSNVREAEQAVERLLDQDRKIMELQHEIRAGRLRRLTLVSVYSSTPVLFLLLLIGNIATWRRIDLARVNMACIPIFAALLAITLIVTVVSTDDNWLREEEWEAEYVDSKRLDLELEIERKRLSAASLHLSSEIRRHVNRETVPTLIEQYRAEGTRYRRTHNIFQSVIIIGSLATSTVAGIADTPPPYKWITVGTSFAVGLSAGFTGYFKFRERSFYLQQTADAIEEEYSGVMLKVGRYSNSTDEESALAVFTQRIETLKSDQRKRQQQLDQPTEARDGA